MWRWGYVAALAGVLATACDNTEPDAQGQTHWLRPCDSSEQCNGFMCLCGYCTQECIVDSECVMGARQGNCVGPGDFVSDSCETPAPPRAICLPETADVDEEDSSVPEDAGSDDAGA